MKKNINSDGVLPHMMGTEHELSLTFTPRQNISLDINFDDYDLSEDKTDEVGFVGSMHTMMMYENIRDHVLASFDAYAPNIKSIENGGIVSSISDRPLEIATPECLNPKQLLTYSLASRLLLKNWMKDYLEENSSDLRSISMNERVIDSQGNTWGEHDNYSLLPEESGYGVIQDTTPPLIWLHLLTRGTITGAGVVYGSGGRCWSLSQKTPTVSSIHDKKWGSTAMWGDDERLEIRCSDKNVSEWAHLTRIGSAALVLALTRTGFTIEDVGIDEDLLSLDKVGDYDALHVSRKGNVKLTYEAKIAVTIQKILAEASLRMLDEYDESANLYRSIAHKWLTFAEKLEKASHSDGPLDLSQFIESDWAAKFYGIQNKMISESETGILREPHDFTARAQDIMYDRIMVDAPMPKEKIYESEGSGFKLNNRVPSRKIINQKDINLALNEPPINSRADSRSKFIKFLIDSGCEVGSFDWASITWLDKDGEYHERHF